MSRDLKFSVEVLENAEYQANPIEWFAKAYLGEDVADNFRALPGIKTKTKLAYTLFTSLLKKADCEFDGSAPVLGAVNIDVETVAVMIEVCQFEVEQSFLVAQMPQGANAMGINELMSQFWETAAMEVAEEIELIRWQGDTDVVHGDDEEFLDLQFSKV